MFVQVIQGRVSDAEEVRAALDRWVQELAPGAEGWLGSTSGVTEDGRFISLARFESAAAARRNSDRPEQGNWWADTSKLFSDEPTFLDSERVDVDLHGDPGQAGFVQVIQGQTSDPARARELMADGFDWHQFRPDMIGSVSAEHPEGRYTTAIYFTSEQAARAGERKEPPAELQQLMTQMQELAVGEEVYFDLRQPWLNAPG